MKRLILALLISVFALLVFAQNGTIELTFTGIENAEGFVEIGVFNSEKTFPEKGKEYRGERVKLTQKDTLNYSIENIPAGTYAIAAWHDKNGNRKMDKNLLGIPKEKYGFSKNRFGKFGPPGFEKIAFNVTAGKVVKLTINLK
jgi:uncharacterized protein (DUF2141 family)